MYKSLFKICLMTTAISAFANASYGETLPEGAVIYKEASTIGNQKIVKYTRKELMTVRALPSYNEAPYLKSFVKAGKLPTVKNRLPNKPVVLEKGLIPDSIGRYGGTIRHMTGGRPQGWNWTVGQAQGYSGMEATEEQCLVDTGPMYRLKTSDLSPLPNLAQDWKWNADYTKFTVHLLEGAKWSDGYPFDTEDIRFYWQNNVLDTNVNTRMSKDYIAKGIKMKILDKYHFQFEFPGEKNVHAVYALAFLHMCPGPAHVLKKYHPKYNKKSTYSAYNHSLKPSVVPWVSMGPWIVTKYVPDQYLIMRRNPYYFKVDYKGNQLPYANEMVMKLGTGDARALSVLNGSIDYANANKLANYSEVARQLGKGNKYAVAKWTPRTRIYNLYMNMAEDVGTTTKESKYYRLLNQKLDFRKAVSMAIDRQTLINSIARGPFAVPFYGGTVDASPYYTNGTTYAYKYNPELAKKLLDRLGLKDTDGDGIRNFTSGPLKGKNVSIEMAIATGQGMKLTANYMTTMLRKVGIKITSHSFYLVGSTLAVKHDWTLVPISNQNAVPFMLLNDLAPTSYSVPMQHIGLAGKKRNLMPFEIKLVDIVNKLKNETDNMKIHSLLADYQRIFTKNLYTVGLYQMSIGILTNKYLKNIPMAPGLLYQYYEDAGVRDLWWYPKGKETAEILPNTIPATTYKFK